MPASLPGPKYPNSRKRDLDFAQRLTKLEQPSRAMMLFWCRERGRFKVLALAEGVKVAVHLDRKGRQDSVLRP
jgi:hypothetical protein